MGTYTLAIANSLAVKVKGAVRDENGAERAYDFKLICRRVSNDELRDILTSPPERRITADEFFEKNVQNWRGQDLVTDADGRVAEFSPDALRTLFTIAGMASKCWEAYLEQVVAVAKN